MIVDSNRRFFLKLGHQGRRADNVRAFIHLAFDPYIFRRFAFIYCHFQAPVTRGNGERFFCPDLHTMRRSFTACLERHRQRVPWSAIDWRCTCA